MYKPASVFVVSLAALAALALSLQFFSPHVDFYHRSLVSQLETLTGSKIEAGGIQTTMHDFHLAVSLQRVSFINPQRAEEKAYAERLHVGVSLLDSLRRRQAVIVSVLVEGAELKFRRERSSVRLIGVPVLPVLAAHGSSPIRFEMIQSSIVWDDAVHRASLKLFPVQIDFSSDGMEHAVSAESSLAGDSRAMVRLHAAFSGALSSPATWNGRLTADTRGMAAMEPWLPFLDQRLIESGRVSFKAEAEWRAGRLLKADGFVFCSRCRQRSSALPERMDFSARWQWLNPLGGGQTLQLKDVRLDAPPVLLEHAQLTLARGPHGRRRLEAEIPEMNADTIAWLNRRVPKQRLCAQPCWSAQSASLAARMQGGDHAVLPPARSSTKSVSWSDRLLSDWTRFSSATVSLLAKKAVFRSLLWDDYQPHFDHLSGEIQLGFGESSRRITVRNMRLEKQDSQLLGELSWLAQEDRPALEADLRMRDWPVETMLDLISLRQPPPRLSKLKKWLRASVLDGQIREGRIRMSGNPSRFPFAEGGGQWQAAFSLEHGVFSYHNRYPGDIRNVEARILFSNESMQLTASRLDYQGMHADHTVVKVPDIFDLTVQIEVHGHAALRDVLSFMQKENLLKKDGMIAQHVLVDGEGDFDLSLQVPVKQLKEKGLSFHGRLRPHKAEAAIPRLGMRFSDIDGELNFSRAGGLPSTMTALFNGVPVGLHLAPEKGFNALTMKGRLSAADLLPAMSTRMAAWSRGSSDWNVKVMLPAVRKPSARGERRHFQIDADSSLLGASLHLPSPLAKSTPIERTLHLGMRFNEEEAHYELAYGERLRARLSAQAEQPHLTGHVHFGGQPARWVKDRFEVTGTILEPVELEAWRSFLADAASGKNRPSWRHYLSDVKLLLRRLQWGHHRWNDLTAEMRMQNNKVWVLRLQEDKVKGALYVPPEEDKVPVLARFDRLNLQKAEQGAPRRAALPDDFNPSVLPPLRLELKNFSYGDIQARKVKIRTEPAKGAMQAKQLEFQVGGLTVTADADQPSDWRRQNDQSTSRFSFSVQGSDMGEALRAWNVHTGISNKNSLLKGRIAWNGAPYDFSLAALQGSMDLRLEDGVLKKVKPGIGRLLGLLSIESVVRRISLDFSDLFNEGLAFDKMEGKLQFDHGAMNTRNFSIVGPAMEIVILGRTGIVSRDYDQDIYVVPDLSENLPVLSGLIGGPLVGAAVFLLDRLTKIGSQINKTVTLQYKMTGSWDNAEIDFVGAPKINPRKLKIFQKPPADE